jgi:Rrf2 family nitric oxide-sensitive transcriptional repressor
VLRATEPDFDLVECFDATRNQCPLTGACRLQDVMGQARRAFLTAFDAHTLADLLRSRNTLVRLRSLS